MITFCLIHRSVLTSIILAGALCVGKGLHAQSASPSDVRTTSEGEEAATDSELLDPELIGDLQSFLDEALSSQEKQGSSSAEKSSVPSDLSPGDLSDGAQLNSQREWVESLRMLDQQLTAASAGLARGDVGASTQSAQQQAITLMRAILDRNGQDQNQQSSNESQRSARQGDSQREKQAAEPGDEQQQNGSEMRDLGSQPGSDVGTGGETMVKLSDIQAMREAVWGHLPERVRGQMRASRPEDYLPRYRDAIREYFNQLSAPSDAER
ncbi:MAG: hypothetical protein R3C05_16895 [Pirellulaceae bacterium]